MGDTFIKLRLTAIDTVQLTPANYPKVPDQVSESAVPYVYRRSPLLPTSVEINRVPEIRIWGATEQGQRCCLHIHGALPYMYLDYKGSVDPDDVQDYIRRLARSLNHAMYLSLKSRSKGDYDPKKDQYIGFVTLVKGIPFYGFHVGYRYFLKIYALQPQYSRRLFDILKGPNILPRYKSLFEGESAKSMVHQVYEAHIPFLLQFMLDFNLYGCDWIELKRCMFRGELPNVPAELIASADSTTSNPPARIYSATNVPAEMIFAPERPHRISPYSTLEFDCHVSDIVNRRYQEPRNLHQDFTEFLHHPIPDDAKLVQSVKGVWDDERARRKGRGEEGPEEIGDDASGSGDRRYARGEAPKWADTDRWQRMLEVLLEEDKQKYLASHAGQWPPTFETFVKPLQWDQWIPTTFKSVESTFPSTWMRDEQAGKENPFGIWASKGVGISAPSRAGTEDVTLDEKWLAALRTRQGSVAASDVGFDNGFGSEEEEEHQLPRAQQRQERDLRAEDDEEDDEEEPADIEVMAQRLAKVNARKEDRESTLTPQRKPMPTNGRHSSSSSTSPDIGQNVPLPSPTLPSNAKEIELLENGLPEKVGNHSETPSRPPAQPRAPEPYLEEGTPLEQPRKPIVSGPLAVPSSQHKAAVRRNFFGINDKPFQPDLHSKRGREEQGKGWMQVKEGPLAKRFRPAEPHHALKTPVAQAAPKTATEMEFEVLQEDPLGLPLEGLARGPSEFDDLRSSDLAYDMPSPTEKASSPTPYQHIKLGADSDLRPNKIRRVAFEDETSSRTMGSSFIGGHGLPDSSTIYDFPVIGQELLNPSEPQVQVGIDSASEPTNSVSTIKLSGQTSSQESLRSTRLFLFAKAPPSSAILMAGLEDLGKVRKAYLDPYYSVARDVSRKPREYAGRSFKILGDGLKWLPEFEHETPVFSFLRAPNNNVSAVEARRWEYSKAPPTTISILAWLSENASSFDARSASLKPSIDAAGRHLAGRSQIEVSSTQGNPYGFKFTQMKAVAEKVHAKEHMTVLCIELQVGSRPGKMPDPQLDAIQALFYCLQTEDETISKTPGAKENCLVGCIMIDEQNSDDRYTSRRLGLSRFAVEYVPDELELINALVDLVRDWDPEVLSGYEIQNSSWGYLLERAQAEYDSHLISELSRVSEQSTGRNEKSDRWNYTKSSTIKITGRHVLPIWRLLKGEINLTSYTFENTVFHVLRRRTPHYPAASLNQWMNSGNIAQKAFVCRYWLARVEMDVELLDESEIISHTTEFARIYGVDFQSVLNRGSQFKVESVMFRIAKPESFLLLSPTREEVARQNALVAYPLIQEPRSAFYKGPLAVLDFQSLYPSTMIAYNYCYSTCLGRIGTFKDTHKFGVINLILPDGLLSLLKNHLIISPNGFLFVKHQVRRSLLAKMLSELLDTRVMVKSSMKLIKSDKALTRVYNARQLGLKLLANVTYGYTSATFSGRMPCAEIADAIVQTGRETLEKARTLIESNTDWRAFCVYGDTDSLFVYMPGKIKTDAFRIGTEMVEAVTLLSPRPVKLKLEKIYLPCVLASKKRYVGFKYESVYDKEPAFDAKGIETVRRDGFPAMQKMVEACIKILFRSQDLSEVKAYCERQWTRIYLGDVSPQDFVFAKEVKLGSYSENGIPPPGAVIAARKQEHDARDEAQYGERVAYIIPEPGDGGARLVDRALTPQEFVLGKGHRLHAEYYVVHTIRALNRVFTLVGVDVNDWYKDMPKIKRVVKNKESNILTQPIEKKGATKKTMDAFWHSNHCVACKRPLGKGELGICVDCRENPQLASYNMLGKTHLATKRAADLQRVCASCGGHPSQQPTECDSAECPLFYARAAAKAEVEATEQNSLEVAKIWTRSGNQSGAVKIEEVIDIL